MFGNEGNGTTAVAPVRVTESLEGLKNALEALQTNVMIADPELRIAYVNGRALATLKMIGGEIRKSFGVGVEEILGGSIHRFHKDPVASSVSSEPPTDFRMKPRSRSAT